MINPTADDVGRRVKIASMNNVQMGKLHSPRGCAVCEENCCFVLYDSEQHPVATKTSKLVWADEVLL